MEEAGATSLKCMPNKSTQPSTDISTQSELIGIEELFSLSWKKTKACWLKVLKIQILALAFIIIPVVLIILVGSVVFRNGLPAEQAATIYGLGFFALLVAYIIAVIYVATAAQVAMLKVVASDQASTERSWTLIRQATPYAWGAVVVGLLSGLATLLGLLFFLIGAIIVSVWLSQSLYVYVFEKKSGISALRESKQLVQGRWWPVFIRLLILQLAFGAVNYVINVIPSLMYNETAAKIISGITAIPASILMVPFALAYTWYIYQSLKQTKGGNQEK